MERSAIGFVIPALNEASTIGSVVRKLLPHGQPLVIDDGSTDNTVQVAENAGATVISHTRNQGYDEALNTGFTAAANLEIEIVITLDADGQHNPDYIPLVIQLLSNGNDLVVGERKHHSRWSESVFAFWTNLRYGLHDPLCGLKGYRISIWKSHGAFDTYGSVGTELALFAIKNGFSWQQLPLTVEKRKGTSRFGNFSAHFKIIRALILSEIPASLAKSLTSAKKR